MDIDKLGLSEFIIHEQLKENVRLDAINKELLEACQYALDALSNGVYEEQSSDCCLNLITVIKKAKGGE